MDVVYPLPPKRAAYEELRYSLRSLANLPHDRVFIAGGLPNWVDNVEHIETVQEWPSKYVNLCVNIASACCDDRVSDPFILFNDDFFVMDPVQGIPARWRETLRDGIERYDRTPHMQRAWLPHAREILDVIEWYGLADGEPVSYELHIPIVVRKAAMLDALGMVSLGPMWRTIYGAVARLGGSQMYDVKIASLSKGPQPGPFASCSDQAWRRGVFSAVVRAAFPNPSPYEREAGACRRTA